MKCYYHPEKDAVAICKECGKPLCEECAHEFNGKIYCEEDLKKIQESSKKKDEKTERREERAERKEERAERREERRERRAQRIEEREKREEVLRDYFPHILLITIAIVAIVIAVLITVFVVPGKRYIIPFNGSNYAITSQYTKGYNSENFLSINGTFGAEDVYIHPTKSVLYRVEGRGDTPTVTYSNGVLTITSEALNNPFLQNLYRRVDIYLNDSLTIDLSVKEGAGNIYISDTGLIFSDVNIQEGAGNVTINNCDTNSLIINSGVGNVNIGKIKNAGNIRLEGGVGTFNVDLSAITGRSSVVIQNGVGNSTVTVSNQSSVRADVNAISVNSDGFTKTNGYYVNSKYTGSEDIYIKISSVGQVNLKEVNYERP
jgi:hypothetical protein